MIVHESPNFEIIEGEVNGVTVEAGQNILVPVPFTNRGLIKVVKVESDKPTDQFEAEIYNAPTGEIFWQAVEVTEIAYDILDIPYIDKTFQNVVYVNIINKNLEQSANFRVLILGLKTN